MIYNGEKRAHLYKGDAHPAELYKGDRYITGWQTENKTGALMEFNNTYNANFDHLNAYGMSTQETNNGANKIEDNFSKYSTINREYMITTEDGDSVIGIDVSGKTTDQWFSINAITDYDLSVSANGFFVSFDYYTNDNTMISGGSNSTIFRVQGYDNNRVRVNWIEPHLNDTGGQWITKPTMLGEWQRVKLYFPYSALTSWGNPAYFRLGFCLTRNGSYKIKRPMLTYGNIDLNYQPYTGGKPSPSFDYPQVIKDLNLSTRVEGRNIANVVLNASYRGDNGGLLMRNGWAVIDPIDTTINKTFYLSYTTVNHPLSVVARELDAGGNVTTRFYGIGSENVTGAYRGGFTVLPTTVETRINLYTNNAQWSGREIQAGDVINVMLSIGATQYNYEPYRTPQIYAVTARGINIGTTDPVGIANYYDGANYWVCDTIDLAKGIYTKRVGEYTQTNRYVTFPRIISGSGGDFYYCSNSVRDPNTRALGYGNRIERYIISNKFTVVNQSTETAHPYSIVAPYGHTNGIELRFQVKTTEVTTIDQLNNILTSTVTYYPCEPVNINISTAFNTIFPTTVITSNTDRIEATAKVVNMED